MKRWREKTLARVVQIVDSELTAYSVAGAFTGVLVTVARDTLPNSWVGNVCVIFGVLAFLFHYLRRNFVSGFVAAAIPVPAGLATFLMPAEEVVIFYFELVFGVFCFLLVMSVLKDPP